MDWQEITSSAWFAPVVSGLVTGTLAILGLVFTQWRTTRRDQATREHELYVWHRTQKLAAHSAFLAEQRRLDQWMMKVTRIGGDGVESPQDGWHHSLSALLTDVQVFGGQDAAIAAQRLLAATIALESGTIGAMMTADDMSEAYRRLVQRDLSIQETALPPWGQADGDDWMDRGRIDAAVTS